MTVITWERFIKAIQVVGTHPIPPRDPDVVGKASQDILGAGGIELDMFKR
jgi:hypothetical protein